MKTMMRVVACFAACHAAAQTPDTTKPVIVATETQPAASPSNRAGKPFYDFIHPDRQGLKPLLFFSRDDRVFVGLNYNRFSTNWRPDSLGQKQKLYAHYSINQRAFSVGYQAIFYQAIGGWNLFVDAGYDWERWRNFYGLGNETVEATDDRNFYRIRSQEALIAATLQHKIGSQSSIILTPSYQKIQLKQDPDRYLAKSSLATNGLFNYEAKHFASFRADLHLQRLNNLLLPTRGIVLSTAVTGTKNLSQAKSFINYSAYSRGFLPFLKRFVLSVEAGAAAVTGAPEFYQLNSIGGSTLRGYRRERFWGETIFHNNNELQYYFDVNHRWFEGKFGLLAFADQGRIWKRGEDSDRWHRGYGGGIILVPFNKVYASFQWGVSKENNRTIHLELRRAF